MNFKERAQQWLDSPKVSEEDKEIIRHSSDDKLQDMFGADLAFGTAGLRGEMGPGTNRMNPLVIQKATVGMANFVLEHYGEKGKKRGVAVSFDSRFHSQEFAKEVCSILNAYGINTYTFACPHPTPELSYTTRVMNCCAGIMVTASHNPSAYNGYKVYDETGCQMVYENIDNLMKSINALPDFLDVEVAPKEGTEPGKNTVLGENFDEAFVEKEASTSVLSGKRNIKIVYTSQCGCNVFLGPWTLRKLGYTVTSVPGQDRWDGNFDGVHFPNPEFPESFVKAKALLEKLHKKDSAYCIALCNDPDADRVGFGFIGSDNKFHLYTGNRTGGLLINYIMTMRKKNKTLHENGYIVSSFVTSNFGADVASKKFKLKVHWVPTGFKYTGYMIEHTKAPFEFGYEESYGYITEPFVRDKDCLQSNVAIADMVEWLYRQGKTVDQYFEELEAKFGHYENVVDNIYVDGLVGRQKMTEQLHELRVNPLKEIGGDKVIACDDYLERKHFDLVTGKVTPITDIPSCDCLKYFFKDGWLACRPSGTEPKCKIYVETVTPSEKEGVALAKKIKEDFKKHLKLK